MNAVDFEGIYRPLGEVLPLGAWSIPHALWRTRLATLVPCTAQDLCFKIRRVGWLKINLKFSRTATEREIHLRIKSTTLANILLHHGFKHGGGKKEFSIVSGHFPSSPWPHRMVRGQSGRNHRVSNWHAPCKNRTFWRFDERPLLTTGQCYFLLFISPYKCCLPSMGRVISPYRNRTASHRICCKLCDELSWCLSLLEFYWG